MQTNARRPTAISSATHDGPEWIYRSDRFTQQKAATPLRGWLCSSYPIIGGGSASTRSAFLSSQAGPLDMLVTAMSERVKSTAARPPLIAAKARAAPAVFMAHGGGRLVRLQVGNNLLGRTPDARVRVDEAGISRQHANIVVADDGTVELLDLESKNGTFLDNVRVTRSTLTDGARIRLGQDVELRFGWWDETLLVPDERGELEFTARELQIVRLVAKGLSNGEIAARLRISVRTVSTHLARIYGRSGIKTRTALARHLLDRGLGG